MYQDELEHIAAAGMLPLFFSFLFCLLLVIPFAFLLLFILNFKW